MLKLGTLLNTTADCTDIELCKHFLLLKYFKASITLYDLDQPRQIFDRAFADSVLVHEDENTFYLFSRYGDLVGTHNYKTGRKIISSDKPADFHNCHYEYERGLYGRDWPLLKLGVKCDENTTQKMKFKYELEMNYDEYYSKNGYSCQGVQILKIKTNDDAEYPVIQVKFPVRDNIHINDDFLVVRRYIIPYFYVEFSKLLKSSQQRYEEKLDIFLNERKNLGISDSEKYALSLQLEVAQTATKIAEARESCPSCIQRDLPEKRQKNRTENKKETSEEAKNKLKNLHFIQTLLQKEQKED